MDPRLQVPYDTIFQRRQKEWNIEKILFYFEKIFSNIELLEGWKYVSCELLKTTKVSKEEINKSLSDTVRVILTNPKEEEVKYDFVVPRLIGGQFFYIGGNQKIPLFQIFDYPIIFRKDLLKLRTNTLTVNINLKKGTNVKIFGKDIPLSLLLAAFYGTEKSKKKDFEEFIQNYIDNPLILDIYEQTKQIYTDMDDLEIIKKLGQLFSTNAGDQVKKGKTLVFSLQAAYDIDFFTQKFLETNSLLKELVFALYQGPKSDTDVSRKRLRFAEYIFSTLIKKFYDMIVILYTSGHKQKFNIQQNILIDSCNVSEIVRYNYPINPVTELAMICQCSLTGPGGFKKDNVPGYLRDLDPSQFGRICPADTPDRSGCGVTLNLVPTVKLDEDGRFLEPNEEIVTSLPIMYSPFLRNDDQTRLQMASNQTKQSILLRETEGAIVRSGAESAFLDYTSFYKRAPKDGVVIYLDVSTMVVLYDDGTPEAFDIGYRQIYKGFTDYIKPMKKEDERFTEGEVLYQSHFIKETGIDGGYGEVCLGKNLLTAVQIYKGFNYEDGIVISESVAEKKFTSLHYVEMEFQINPSQVLLSLVDDKYVPLPKVGSRLKKGDPYARIKSLDILEDLESINLEPIEKIADQDCTVIDIEIYPNSWNKQVKEYQEYIEKIIMEQTQKYALIENKLISNSTNPEKINRVMQTLNLKKKDCFGSAGKYYQKGQKINGILFKIKAIYQSPITIGDKIANRHGNKGVISKIEKDENMPVLPDGRRVEIIINPLGIISRMNVGQLYEMHLGECIHSMSKKLVEKYDNYIECKNFYKGFLDIVDKTPSKWITSRFMKEFDYWYKHAETKEEFSNKLRYIIQPAFQSIDKKDLDTLMKYLGDVDYKYYLKTNEYLSLNKIACGYIYFYKLMHISKEKLAARSIGPYNRKTGQPLAGKSKGGGHRFGEMECWALGAHGADDTLRAFLTVQSDSSGMKHKMLAEILNNPDLYEEEHEDINQPQSLRVLKANLAVLGMRILEERKHTDYKNLSIIKTPNTAVTANNPAEEIDPIIGEEEEDFPIPDQCNSTFS